MANKTLVRGFNNILSSSNPDGSLQWYCEPDSWEGDDSPNRKWSVDSYGSLVLYPPAKKDFWRKTYYNPILVKDDGPILYYDKLSQSNFYTIETSFTLTAARQFDQAGVCLRIGPEHWIKTGIEVVDKKPRLSCVVTNVYSDWSTQSWSEYVEEEDGNVKVTARIRLHCRGTSFVVEARQRYQNWEFIRIAHLSPKMCCKEDPLASHSTVTNAWEGPAAEEGKMWAGVFACCPEDQQGSFATFTSFQITEGSRFEHNANGNQE